MIGLTGSRRGGRLRSGLVAALDVGSSKICCAIGRHTGEGAVQVEGFGTHAAQGTRAGAVVDMEAARQAIAIVVAEAEKQAGERLRSLIVNVGSNQLISRTVKRQLPVMGGRVEEDALVSALRDAALGATGRDETPLHAAPVSYDLDGTRGIRDPRGMEGQQLSVDLHLVTAQAAVLRNLTSCITSAHLDVEALVATPLASGLAALVPDEMELGVTLIDIGAGTTSIAVFFEGNLVFCDCVPVGGGHVTNDIARGLMTPIAFAERLKTLEGQATAQNSDEHSYIDHIPEVGDEDAPYDSHLQRSTLARIIQPRLEETFELVRSRLEASGFNRMAGRRAVLTGGAAQLPGIGDLAGTVMDKKVRVGGVKRLDGLPPDLRSPVYATLAGLLLYAFEHGGTDPTVLDSQALARAAARSGGRNGLFSRLGGLFRAEL